MKSKSRRWVGPLTGVMAGAFGSCTAAYAADEAPLIEPSKPWMAILLTVLATLLVCLVAFKSTRRTHLD